MEKRIECFNSAFQFLKYVQHMKRKDNELLQNVDVHRDILTNVLIIPHKKRHRDKTHLILFAQRIFPMMRAKEDRQSSLIHMIELPYVSSFLRCNLCIRRVTKFTSLLRDIQLTGFQRVKIGKYGRR